jgi:hypothetical protein
MEVNGKNVSNLVLFAVKTENGKLNIYEKAISFMGNAPPNGTLPREALNRWVSNKDYSDLFNQTKKGGTKDPNILLINGFISKNDTIELGDWYYLENREIANNSQGNYSVELLDKNGQIIEKAQFDINFFMLVDPLGEVDIDPTPFIFPVAYPENTLKVKIKHNDKIVAEINPNAKLLHDAINLTPDKGFIDNPEQRKNDLHNKIKEIEDQINEGNITDAKNKLEFDVKDKLEKWLVDNYQKETPFQFSKSELLNIVDNIILRLAPTLTPTPIPTPTTTPPTPPPTAGTCLGDITGDSNVNSDDFVLFAIAYDSASGDLKYNVKADVNNNGVINSEDFVLFASVYGKAC